MAYHLTEEEEAVLDAEVVDRCWGLDHQGGRYTPGAPDPAYEAFCDSIVDDDEDDN